ncbi:LysR family transcriptional regulator [Paraburkholderia xenovorans]|uniref:LysR family transcriptional regulator n=1 Tax=Paraburkholderia xenovorans TaxID=36873 RepID=UPI0038BDC872
MSGLTMARLRYLFEVVRLGGVRLAADFLDVAPSAVSRQVAMLEKIARTPLLETNRRGAKPTEVGLLLIAYYREQVAREEALVSQLDGMNALESGHVALGAVQGFADDLMRHALSEFNARHPNMTIALKLGGINDILGWLEDDEVHLGLTYGPGLDLHDARLKELASVAQPLCAVVGRDHPLARHESVSIDDLIAYPFALARPGYGTRKIVEQIEAARECRFTVSVETDHLLGLTAFVRAGMGLTLLPAFAIHDDIERGALIALPVRHALMQDVKAQLVSRRGRELPVGALALQRLLSGNMLAFRV